MSYFFFFFFSFSLSLALVLFLVNLFFLPPIHPLVKEKRNTKFHVRKFTPEKKNKMFFSKKL